MIIEVVCSALLLACVDGRVLNSSSMKPDTLYATWSLSGRSHLAPKNFSSSSLHAALRNAVTTLSEDSFHIGKLAGAAFGDLQLPHVEDSDAFLRLVQNIVECALDHEQVAQIQTSEGETLNIPGLVGLAPQWSRRGIDKDAQESVSACLAARATIFETPSISVRGSALGLYADPDEEKQFAILEGQFWGNIFDEEEAVLMSCWASNTALAWNQARVCATGNPVGIGRLSCGMITNLGHCKRFCKGGPESEAPYSIRICDSNIHIAAVYLRKKSSKFPIE